MSAATPVTPELPKVLHDVTVERQRQIDKGWTTEHDNRHLTHDLVSLAERRIHSEGSYGPGLYSRERLIEGIAMLVAAVEARDRRESRGDD